MNPTVESREGVAWVGGKPRTYKRGMSQKEYTPFVKHFAEGNEGLTTAHFLSDYVNHNETRAALNIPDEVQAWNMCWNNSEFTYHYQQEASMWIYPILKGAGIRQMFYSGDTDGAVVTYGSKQWIRALNFPVKNAWRPWYDGSQVAGYIEQYEGLDFITVKGVGHMAPQYKRKAVTEMISNFIHERDI